MLTNHRRTFLHAVLLLAALGALFVAVGRGAPSLAPTTSVPIVGEWDAAVYRAMDDVRTPVLEGVARALNVLGGGLVTIPLRAVVAVVLAVRRRWRAAGTWALTWIVAESVLALAKGFFHRGRPPGALVATGGYSFPSGHAVAGASIAVALVLVLMEPGVRRRAWEWMAAGFAFVMATSRVYLNAHWFSDVVAGVLLGTGVALAAAAVATEVRDHVLARRRGGPPHAAQAPSVDPP